MTLNLKTLESINIDGNKKPTYDISEVRQNTYEKPTWLHFGAGNLFRAFPAVLAQSLLENGKANTGIITCESFDEELVEKCFNKHDNLSISVTLNADGNIEREIVASVCESLSLEKNYDRVVEIFCNKSLQIVTFTITEKGYAICDINNEFFDFIKRDMQNSPQQAKSFMAKLVYLCIKRMHSCNTPLTLLSFDNCAPNGEKLKFAFMSIAEKWHENSFISDQEYTFLKQNIAFPVSMIDKITPRPDDDIARMLQDDGFCDMFPIVTSKNSHVAPFVNAEKPQYLVIENDFLNGRPQLEFAGAVFADREVVDKAEQMKVCTCLNPPQTALSILGCLLNYDRIWKLMQDKTISKFVYNIAVKEGMPVVVDPKVINAEHFVNEVLQNRLINSFIPDTPQRIVTDTSQKIGTRFGGNIKKYHENGKTSHLVAMPLVIATWLRYLIGIDDEGNSFNCSPDPNLVYLQQKLLHIRVGDTDFDKEPIYDILKDEKIFTCDLVECQVGNRIIEYFSEMLKGKGAIRKTLEKYAV